MTVRLLAVAGLHLDRAWLDESPGAARGLREASAGLLLELVQRTLDLRVDVLAILGGLWDPSTVRSSTVDDVRTALGAIPVPVIVLPTSAEAESGFHPRTLTGWPDTVNWVGGDDVTVETSDGLIVAQGPRAHRVPPTDEALAFLTTRASVPDIFCPILQSAPSDSDAGFPERSHPQELQEGSLHSQHVQVAALVGGSGGGRPRGELVVLEPGSAPRVEHVHFSPSFGETRHLDIGQYADSESLAAALDEMLAGCAPLDRVIIAGRVGPRVLVPPALRWEQSRPDVTVLWRELEYVSPEPPGDRTVQAELIRRLSGPGPEAARRHQALALGLASLDSQEVTV